MFPEVVRWLAPTFAVPRLFLSTFLILRRILQRESTTKQSSSSHRNLQGHRWYILRQFSFFDGAEEGVYFKPDSTETLSPKFSHHRLTCFEFADGVNNLSTLISNGTVPTGDYSAVPNILERTDLDIYYQKVSKAFATIPDTSGDPTQDQIQARVEENRIVGPISDEYRVLQITRNGQTATAVTVDEFDNPRDHGFSVGVNINVSGVTGSTGPQLRS